MCGHCVPLVTLLYAVTFALFVTLLCECSVTAALPVTLLCVVTGFYL